MNEAREPALGEVIAGAVVVAIDHDRKTYTTRERGVEYWCSKAEEADRRELAAAMAKHEANFLVDYVRAAGPAEVAELDRAARMEREVAAYRRGRRDERAAVVAWLRKKEWRRPIPLCTDCRKARAYGPHKDYEDATDDMLEVRAAIVAGEHSESK